jgi:hypothetical protein
MIRDAVVIVASRTGRLAGDLAGGLGAGIYGAMTNPPPTPLCWICGGIATTAEHTTN